MQDLRLIGVHEDGEHLLLADPGGARFRVRVDEPLRAAVRRDRPRLGQLQIEIDGGLRPRDVQAMIRAGASAEEAAERAGWPVEKVHRYEGPIIAEREHVAGLARAVRLRGRGGTSASAPTLAARVGQRLTGRGVDPAEASWDSWRADEGPWTVVVTFPAGGRQRQASWHFDAADRTVTAVDDEARWLSEDEQPTAGPLPAPHLASAPVRATAVYDVEAEGGLQPGSPRGVEHAVPADGEPLDLMTAMRERSAARGRRGAGSRRGPRHVPTHVPGPGPAAPDEALPLADIAYDPETMPPPPAAHVHPSEPSELDSRPEPEAALEAGELTAYLVPGPAGGAQPRPDDERADRADPVEADPVDAAIVDADTVEADPVEADTVEPAGAEIPPEPAAGIAPEPEATSKASGQPGAARTASRKKAGRPSVPSWDDIMFGARPGRD